MANALNPSIILAGQGLDVVGAMDAGAIAGQRANQFKQQNALNAYLQQNGGAVMGGDQNALNALAGFGMDGLNAAQGVQSNRLGMDKTRLGMDATRQNMTLATSQEARLTRQEERAIQEHAASMSREQRTQEAAQIESAVAQGLAATSPEQWDAVVSQTAPDLVGQFDNREMIAGRYMSVADVLKRSDEQASAGQINPNDRFKVVGQQLVDLGAEGGPQTVLTDPGQEEVIYGPDGQPILTRGPAGTSAKFTEGQSKDNVFSTRARGALEALEPVAEALTSRSNRAADYDPTGLARGFQSPEYQVAQQAGDEFLQAILRKDTGAAITQQEQDAYGNTYLPRPGDLPERIEAKRQSRIRAINAIEAGMNPAQMLAQERALANSAAEAGTVQPQGQITAEVIRSMSPEAASQYMMTTPLEQIPTDVLDALIERGQ
jgi:hypothetical protein